MEMEEIKKCRRCGELKVVSKYQRILGDKLRAQCRDCYNEQRRKNYQVTDKGRLLERWRNHYERHKERIKAYQAEYQPKHYKANRERYRQWRFTWQLKRYGMSREDLLKMLEGQGGRCKICGYEFGSGNKRRAIDHCHESGKVRGILCNGCNVAIALLGTVENCESAVQYLKQQQ